MQPPQTESHVQELNEKDDPCDVSVDFHHKDDPPHLLQFAHCYILTWNADRLRWEHAEHGLIDIPIGSMFRAVTNVGLDPYHPAGMIYMVTDRQPHVTNYVLCPHLTKVPMFCYMPSETVYH